MGVLRALFVAAMGGFACSLAASDFYCLEASTVSWWAYCVVVREVEDAVTRVDFLASLAGGGDCF